MFGLHHCRHVLAAGAFAATLASAGCAGSGLAPAGVAPEAAAPAAGQPHYSPTRVTAASRQHPDFFVPYHGGPVLTDPKVYIVFWGYKAHGDPNHVQQLLVDYTKSMGGSAHNNIETQYYETVGSVMTYIINPTDQFGGSWNDNSAIPKTPTDSQIAAEAVKAVKHFGFDTNGAYVVATARGHSSVGFGTNWCSYHNWLKSKGNPIPYINLPYEPDAGVNCGAGYVKAPKDESADDEGVTIMAGHEYGEAITDPQPFSAWNGVDGEIADPCSFQHIANEKFQGKIYTSQPMISDATGACVQKLK